MTFGLAGSLLAHAALVPLAALAPGEGAASLAPTADLTVDVELRAPTPAGEPDAPAPDPAQPPEPPPRLAPKDAAPPAPDDPYADLDTPARATPALTAKEAAAAPDTPTVATGDGKGPGYGVVAGDGAGDTPTYDAAARVGGTRRAAAAVTSRGTSDRAPDRSRAAALVDGYAPECDFPDSADDIDAAVVVVVVLVGEDGHAREVEVVSDPGRGFGAVARRCALARLYRAARDPAGRPLAARTGPIRVRFSR
jgi:protein TonB